MRISKEVPVEVVTRTEMHRSVKCDVCGVETEPRRDDIGFEGDTPPSSWACFLLPDADNNPAYKRKRLDLCPKCTRGAIMSWTKLQVVVEGMGVRLF